MSDEGEMWKEHKTARQKKRWANVASSLKILRDKGFTVECLNEAVAHYRIGYVSFWPTTGKFYDTRTGNKGRGVFNLMGYLSRPDVIIHDEVYEKTS